MASMIAEVSRFTIVSKMSLWKVTENIFLKCSYNLIFRFTKVKKQMNRSILLILIGIILQYGCSKNSPAPNSANCLLSRQLYYNTAISSSPQSVDTILYNSNSQVITVKHIDKSAPQYSNSQIDYVYSSDGSVDLYRTDYTLSHAKWFTLVFSNKLLTEVIKYFNGTAYTDKYFYVNGNLSYSININSSAPTNKDSVVYVFSDKGFSYTEYIKINNVVSQTNKTTFALDSKSNTLNKSLIAIPFSYGLGDFGNNAGGYNLLDYYFAPHNITNLLTVYQPTAYNSQGFPTNLNGDDSASKYVWEYGNCK